MSGGERQRLALAHALLKNAPILLLDAVTAREIRKTLRELIPTRTTLLITHHLADLEMTGTVVLLANENENGCCDFLNALAKAVTHL